MTELLTMSYSHNNRTREVVENYLTVPNVQTIDKMEIPKSVLLDIAESNRVTDLRSVINGVDLSKGDVGSQRPKLGSIECGSLNSD